MKLPDFLIIPSQLIKDKKLTPTNRLVYSVVYWYSKLKLEKCILSNQSFSELLGVSKRSVRISLTRLAERKYIKITYDKKTNHRKEIVPLIVYQLKIPLEEIFLPPGRNLPHNKIDYNKSKKNTQQHKVAVREHKRLPLEKQNTIHRLCYYLEDLLDTKIVNWGKQGKAIKQMMRAGYTEDQIKKTIAYMAKKDEFFADKGFDLTTVSSQISRYKAMANRKG